ncbi:MAG: helix-hairpin-helix domain-containing protein, partial [Candidatus Hydrogenedentes bacterium]|nr:helix-hairpin-helix domain-containing protein [Candidatus Hydrogenedentota bacterium]
KSSATKNAAEQKTKFEAYYDYAEPLKKIPSHRFLAVLRGVRMGLLRMDLTIDDDRVLQELVTGFIKVAGSPYDEHIAAATHDAYKRLLRPSIENEVVGLARQAAEEEAIRVFRENARNLLLSAPAGRLVVMGVDPGIRTGCKLAVVDNLGHFIANATIFPMEPQKDEAAAERSVRDLIDQHEVRAVAVGNGTGSREVARFLEGVLKRNYGGRVFLVFVNEAGASVYSASKLARQEFPDLDVTVRGAISIARRLQDPLAELVKIEPRSIGVGQYQHDVNQRRLREGLYKTVEWCVNAVGVDLNSASVELLRYISGIQMGTAQNIVEFRAKNGAFKSRQQLLEVSGIGDRTFEQAAGFLRIPGAENPLDATAIHPEAYPVVERIAEKAGVAVAELIKNPRAFEKINIEEYSSEHIGKFTLDDIRQELMKPGRDPRREFRVPRFVDGVADLAHLQEGTETEGVVTNVTDFGAFVDIGVHQDGLVHLSELANRFVRDPGDVVKVGDIVRVKVMKVDKEMNRISLSMKALKAVQAHEPARVAGDQKPDHARPPRERAAGQERRPTPERGERPKRSGASSEADHRERPPRKREKAGKHHRPGKPDKRPTRQPEPEQFNTILADQLAALREKLAN